MALPAVGEITGGLGERWEFADNTYKPYPCGIVMHAVVDACLALRRDNGVMPEAIAEVVVSGDQLLLDRGDRALNSERDARVSIHHCAAVALLFGAAGVREFSEAVVCDPRVVALRALTKARLDAAAAKGSATVTVRLHDGRTPSSTVLHPRGSKQQPMTDQEIEAKVRELAGASADALIAAAWQLDTLPTIAPLLTAAGRRA